MTARLAAFAILDLVLLAAAAQGWAPVGIALACHALLTGVAVRGWLRSGERLGTAPAIAGMAGPVALLAARAFVPTRPAATTGSPTDDEPERRAASSGLRMLDGRVHHAAPDALGSLVTVLRFGAVHDRRRALESVVRSFRPALSPLLAIALTDRDQTIRALAAAAAARVGQKLTDARTGAEPPAAGSEDDRPTLAALLVDHARNNVLLSDSQRHHLLDDALALLDGDASDGLRRQTRIEAHWAAGDYEAVDTLVAETALEDAVGTAAAVDLWRRSNAR